MTPMPLEINDVARALVDVLNGVQLSTPFEAVFAYVPIYDLKDMKDLKVTVVPHGEERETADRVTTHREFLVDVGVQQKVDPDDPVVMGGLMTLAAEIANLFGPDANTDLQTTPTAHWTGTKRIPVYDPQHLVELRQFTSIIQFKFEVWQ